MSVEIIRIEPTNTFLLDNVAADVFDLPIHPDRVARLAEQEHQILMVAVTEGIVIGQILAVIHHHPDKPTELYIDDLGVTPSHHRQHIASDLVQQALAAGRNAGYEEIWVLTEPDNLAANGLYSSFGWKQSVAHMFEAEIS